MSLPTLTGVARLTEAPELRFTASGKAVCKLRLAFNSRKKDPSGNWIDGDVYYVDGSVWDQEAENVAEGLDKGHEVLVTGRLKTRQYDDREGNKRTATDLMIDSIGPTLKFATVKVHKMARSSNAPASAPQGGSSDDPWASRAADRRSGFGGQSASFDVEPPPF